jgi:hypothetical protein
MAGEAFRFSLSKRFGGYYYLLISIRALMVVGNNFLRTG